MRLPRVFITAMDVSNDRVEISGDSFNHLAVVLRRRAGDTFWALLPDSTVEYLVEITEITSQLLVGNIIKKARFDHEPHFAVTLYQGLPKGKRFDLVLQKCTELGVSRIVPVTTQHTVVKLATERSDKKLQRWQKIVEQAARQCMQLIPSSVSQPLTFADALADWQNSGIRGLFLDETLAGRECTGLHEVLGNLTVQKHLAVFVGPEGGFAPEEVQAAAKAGLQSVGLGSRILRTETAAIAVCAIIMYEAGELG